MGNQHFKSILAVVMNLRSGLRTYVRMYCWGVMWANYTVRSTLTADCHVMVVLSTTIHFSGGLGM